MKVYNLWSYMLPSLNIIFLECIPVVAHISISFPFIALYSIVERNHILFIHSLDDELLVVSNFCLLCVSNAAMRTHV